MRQQIPLRCALRNDKVQAGWQQTLDGGRLTAGLLCLAVRQIHFSAWLLVVLSTILQVLIFPLAGLYVLSWLAFAPLIVALLRARPARVLEMDGSTNLQAATPGQAFLLAYVSGILWYAGTCYWIYNTMHEHGGLSAPFALLALFLFCLYLGLYHGLFGLLLSWSVGPGVDRRAVSVGRGGVGALQRYRLSVEPAGHRAGG